MVARNRHGMTLGGGLCEPNDNPHEVGSVTSKAGISEKPSLLRLSTS